MAFVGYVCEQAIRRSRHTALFKTRRVTNTTEATSALFFVPVIR